MHRDEDNLLTRALELARLGPYELSLAHPSAMLANAGPGRIRFGHQASMPFPSMDSCLRCRFSMSPGFPVAPQSTGQFIVRPVASTMGVSRQTIGVEAGFGKAKPERLSHALLT